MRRGGDRADGSGTSELCRLAAGESVPLFGQQHRLHVRAEPDLRGGKRTRRRLLLYRDERLLGRNAERKAGGHRGHARL